MLATSSMCGLLLVAEVQTQQLITGSCRQHILPVTSYEDTTKCVPVMRSPLHCNVWHCCIAAVAALHVLEPWCDAARLNEDGAFG